MISLYNKTKILSSFTLIFNILLTLYVKSIENAYKIRQKKCHFRAINHNPLPLWLNETHCFVDIKYMLFIFTWMPTKFRLHCFFYVSNFNVIIPLRWKWEWAAFNKHYLISIYSLDSQMLSTLRKMISLYNEIKILSTFTFIFNTALTMNVKPLENA